MPPAHHSHTHLLLPSQYTYSSSLSSSLPPATSFLASLLLSHKIAKMYSNCNNAVPITPPESTAKPRSTCSRLPHNLRPSHDNLPNSVHTRSDNCALLGIVRHDDGCPARGHEGADFLVLLARVRDGERGWRRRREEAYRFQNRRA